mmetsp:Transcript_5661/g.11821  ORF Transcript_5661/g.11821 Transcript_5661/m.11821 type:complete len:109 (+) Transcript_5661:84-410(+)
MKQISSIFVATTEATPSSSKDIIGGSRQARKGTNIAKIRKGAGSALTPPGVPNLQPTLNVAPLGAVFHSPFFTLPNLISPRHQPHHIACSLVHSLALLSNSAGFSLIN